MLEQAKELGAVPVVGDLLAGADPYQKIVQEIISRPWLQTWWRRINHDPQPGLALRSAYLLHEHDIRNIERAEILRTHLPKPPNTTVVAEVPPRIIVRIDHFRLAQDFLRRQVRDNIEAFYDTTGLLQMTAREVVDHVLADRPEKIVVTGDTEFTEVFLHEWAIRQELEAMLDAEPHGTGTRPTRAADRTGSVPMVLLDPRAHHIKDHQAELHPCLTAPQWLIPAPSTAMSSAIAAQLRDVERGVIVRTEDPGRQLMTECEELADDLAEDLDGAAFPIFVPSTSVRGVSPLRSMASLRPYGETLTVRTPEGQHATSQVEDNWLRAARLLNETYQVTYGGSTWEELTETRRQGNLRAILSLLTLAHSRDRTWDPPRGADPAPLDDGDLTELAPTEHQSWLEFTAARCTVYGEKRNEALRVNDNLKQWSDTDLDLVHRTVDSLRTAQEVLRVIGYVPYRTDRP